MITPRSSALRDRFGLPGMRVLQFAFGATAGRTLPAAQLRSAHCVVYTGTHDNDTTRGWYARRRRRNRARLRAPLPGHPTASDIAWDLIRLAWASVAGYADRPAAGRARARHRGAHEPPGPAAATGLALQRGMLTTEVRDRLGSLTKLYSR